MKHGFNPYAKRSMVMKYQFVTLIVAMTLVLIGYAIGCGGEEEDNIITKDQWLTLEYGLTLEQVTERVGPPRIGKEGKDFLANSNYKELLWVDAVDGSVYRARLYDNGIVGKYSPGLYQEGVAADQLRHFLGY